MLQKDKLYNSGCSCLTIPRSKLPDEAKIEPGCYTYYIQQWKSSGIRNTNELHYFVCNGDSDEAISNDAAEKVLVQTLLDGETYSSNFITDETFDKALNAFGVLDDTAWNEFGIFSESQRSQNKTLIREQEQYITRTADIKLEKIKETTNELNQLKNGLSVFDIEEQDRKLSEIEDLILDCNQDLKHLETESLSISEKKELEKLKIQIDVLKSSNEQLKKQIEQKTKAEMDQLSKAITKTQSKEVTVSN